MIGAMRKALLAFLLIAPLAHADIASKRAAIHEMLRIIGADAPDDSKSFQAFDRTMTESDAKEAIAFFRSSAGQHFLIASHDASNANLQRLEDALEAAHKKRTMVDMRSISVAIEAYYTDHNKYPAVKDVDELAKEISPEYIRAMPHIDAWGHPYLYHAEGEHFTLKSAGKDGKIGTPDDLIVEDGEFTQPKI